MGIANSAFWAVFTIGCLFVGVLADRLLLRGAGPRRARLVPGAVVLLLSAVGMALLPRLGGLPALLVILVLLPWYGLFMPLAQAAIADIAPDALRTMAGLGIGASMNPGLRWLASDMMVRMLDTDHAERAFPLRSALSAGVRATTGSDAPCVEPDWLRGISSAVLRDTRGGPSPVGPAERVTLAEAVRSCTATAAWQDHAESWKGTLEPGKVADLCVLGGSLLRTPPAELPELPVDMTLVEGEVVYRAG
ncbi:amidohydrolase family protein [Streptomyces sp. NPDC051684]|uniref:amidohydrolase family protein n=1 Tax=Streptomyces sp. NPDC051684 TaxID=3365670 RepID=UPI0037AFEC11